MTNTTTRLSKPQKKFLESLYQKGLTPEHFECFKSEIRTAESLQKKGLVKFQKGNEPDKEYDTFCARLTESGQKELIQQSISF